MATVANYAVDVAVNGVLYALYVVTVLLCIYGAARMATRAYFKSKAEYDRSRASRKHWTIER